MTSVIHSNIHPDPYPHIIANSLPWHSRVRHCESPGPFGPIGGSSGRVESREEMRGGNDNVTATQENTMRLLDILENGGSVAGQEATDPTGTRESIMKKNEGIG